MIHGSKIFIAEATLQQTQVVWRVATGAGYDTAGGQRRGDAGVFALDGWDDQAEAITAEAIHAVQRCMRSLGRMEAELVRVRPLPLGAMS